MLMNAFELLVQASLSTIEANTNLQRLRQATIDDEAEVEAHVAAEIEAEVREAEQKENAKAEEEDEVIVEQ